MWYYQCVEITKPTLADIEALLGLWKDQCDYHFGLDSAYYVPSSPELSEEFRAYLQKAIAANEPHILVAKQAGNIVGFITFEEGRADYFDTAITKYGEVIELHVKQDLRRGGVGAALMAAAEKFFKEHGIAQLKIQCSSFNDMALSFYHKNGYTDRQILLFKDL